MDTNGQKNLEIKRLNSRKEIYGFKYIENNVDKNEKSDK